MHVDVEPLDGRPGLPRRALTVRADARAFLRAAVARLQAGRPRRRVGRRPAGDERRRTARPGRRRRPPTRRAWDGPGRPSRRTRSPTLRRLLPDDAIVATDAGNFGLWLARHFRFRRPGTFLGPTSGAMGYGLPAAIAAALVHRDRAVVAVAGDGGFAMTMAELETAVREKARVIAIVFDNERYGTIRMHQDRRGAGERRARSPPTSGRSTSPRSPGPSAPAAIRVETDAAFEPALRQALAADRPTVIQLVLDRRWVSPRPNSVVTGATAAAAASRPTARSSRVPWLPRILTSMILARIAQSMVEHRARPLHADRVPLAVARRRRDAREHPAGAARPPDRRARCSTATAGCGSSSSTTPSRWPAMALIAVLSLAGLLPPWLLILIAVLSSLTSILSVTGIRSLFPIIVPKSLWERANAIDSNGYVVATIIGPPLAAGLVAVVGGQITLFVTAIGFGAAAVALIGVPDPETAVSSTGRLLRDALDGVRYAWAQPDDPWARVLDLDAEHRRRDHDDRGATARDHPPRLLGGARRRRLRALGGRRAWAPRWPSAGWTPAAASGACSSRR